MISIFFTEGYPEDLPEMLARSPALGPEQSHDVQQHMITLASQYQGTPMIENIIQESLVWMGQRGIVIECKQKDTASVPKRQTQKERKKSRDGKEKDQLEKKSAMKTAEDVISRIQWDASLPVACFSVGYLDRFTGVVEKAFSSLSWQDVASVDYNTLAIPKHRIQYFKYKNVRVWDKNERLDDVFGSTGGGVTISDVMAKYVETPGIESSPTLVESGFSAAAASADDAGSFQIGVSNHSPEGDGGYEEHCAKKQRPTHFIAIRVTDPDVKEGVEVVQDTVLETKPSYVDFCIKPAALHVTLCTLGLNTVEQISDACIGLKKGEEELFEMAQGGITLTMKDLAIFFDRVLLAKVHHEDDFKRLVNYLGVLFKEAGIDIRDSDEFVPHMTIMKIPQPVAREMKTKPIDSSIFESFTDMYFGKQIVDAIYLCEMSDRRANDGFYVNATHINLLEK